MSILVSAGVGLYQMTVTTPSVNACAAQIDWMLPYFSMVLAVTVTIYSFFLILSYLGTSADHA